MRSKDLELGWEVSDGATKGDGIAKELGRLDEPRLSTPEKMEDDVGEDFETRRCKWRGRVYAGCLGHGSGDMVL
jgi:hypothetical protein